MKNKKIFAIVIAVFAVVFIILSFSIFETNQAGYFQVKQAALTGNMSVRLAPGTYFQWFGDISEYKNVATVGIGESHRGDGSADINAVPVIFNDGSKAQISGLIRVKLPTTSEGAIHLKTEYAGGFNHFIQSGVVPIVNNAIKLAANLRSAQDAYTTLALFQQAVEDQLRNGIYVTKSDKVTLTRSTGDTEEQRITAIVYDEETGLPKRMENRLQQLGCEVLECVIDVPAFDQKVEEMISLRKDEAMKTELAKQSAIRAQQDAITAEQQGLANVAKAKYEKEVEKVQAVTQAQKDFEVAQLNAKKEDENRKALIFKGQGEAEANRLKVQAGLTPQERVEWEYKTKVGVAAELAKANPNAFVPQIMIGGGSGSSNNNAMEAVGLKMMLDVVNQLDSKK
ncbi:MAG TPA: SPFH domain-containing protein [Bacteroidia bacterium]|nr:SPFH domain-containing protein [Bacteroidia bacterium]